MNVNLNPLFLRLFSNNRGNSIHPFTNARMGNMGWQGRDCFIKSSDIFELYETYTAPQKKVSGYIPIELRDYINTNISKVCKSRDVYECNGIKFLASQIPPVRKETLHEVKADNNVIDFGKNQYFKYISSDGTEHYLHTNDVSIGSIWTELERGESHDKVLQEYARFWNWMAGDTTYLGLTYTHSQTHQYLKEAGIEHGFFTIKMGDREVTKYYTANDVINPIQSKEEYDARYKSLTQTASLLYKYEPGSIFKINGKEYVLSESHTLDIPYGEDIYNMKYPENYVYGKKMW